MQFLIVDDDPTNLRLMQAALEGAGHAVAEARNGLEAFEVLNGGRAVGVGASFFFSLPRAQPARSDMEEYGQNTGRR